MRAPCKGRRSGLAVVCLTLLLGILANPADASEIPYDTRTTYGEVGILDMPSARMAPDGQISATAGFLNTSQRYSIAFQFLPWLEGSFRYSRVAHVRGVVALYDRSFSLKMRLFQETADFPDVSMGIRDLLGTGLYGAEYFVATKRIDDFDVTAGLGWGRLSDVDTFPNPFGLIFPSFKTRKFAGTGTGGTVDFGQFFHGPSMGVFGGVVWHTPIENLNLLIDYSSDKYKEEAAGGAFKVRMPVNIGASYRFLDAITLTAGWFYGSSYGAILNVATDPTTNISPQRLGPDVPTPVIRQPKQQVDALGLLIARNRPIDPRTPAKAWITLHVPQPDPDTLALTSALVSEAAGVRDVDVMGHTVLIDAVLGRAPNQQCDRYAEIVSALAPKVQTLAVSNLSDASGKVQVCSIAHSRLAYTADNTSPENVSPGGTAVPAALPPQDAAKKIRDDVRAQQIGVEALSVEPEMVWLYFSNGHYFSEAEAAGRIARVLMADAPPSVEVFHIVSVRNGTASRDFEIARSALERATVTYGTTKELGPAVALNAPPLANPVLDRAWEDTYPRLHWDIGPGLREGFFDPQKPFQIQVLAALNAQLDVLPSLSLEGRVEADIYNNYDLNQLSNSQLPHVRSDIALYLKHGINGIAKLDASYHTRLTPNIYFEARAGYLESMFAGGGFQVLWRPDDERFSLGVDLYQVWQRDFDRLFGVQNYHVLTGHASVYYESPWYGLNFAVHVGRYLAGDYGGTIEVTRRFETGVEIGAFATFTNVPFAKFGEGSFDKGIIVHIPLEWALPFYTRSSYDLHLRSLTRDGGQRLDDDDRLFEETRPTSYGELNGHIDEITAP